MQKFFKFPPIKDKLQIFYMLAFLPLLIIGYFNFKSGALEVIVALYGFILLYTKKHDLAAHLGTNRLQRSLSPIIIIASFSLYYALAPFIPQVAYYGSASYVTYMIGLLLAFFHLSALKLAFSPLFLIIAASSISFMSTWLRNFFSSYVPNFVQMIALIMKAIGENVRVSAPIILTFQTPEGNINVPIAWECVGAYSTLIFSVILLILMAEERSETKTKIVWCLIGIAGTFIVNIIRIILILLAYKYYGYRLAWTIHNYIGGYVLFMAWLIFFLYLFSKRKVLPQKIFPSLGKFG
jgi:exosortase/archaeosortase family protein